MLSVQPDLCNLVSTVSHFACSQPLYCPNHNLCRREAMKLCPQCQFIYEDDQNLCDMDGKALVYDNRPGVFPDMLPAVTGRKRPNAQLKFRVVPAVASFVFPAL